MSNDSLYEAGLVVGHLSRALLDGTRDLATVPGLVKRVIADNMWPERTDPTSRRKIPESGRFASFQSFVEADPHEGGLGLTMTQLDGLCAEDPPARAAIAQQQEADHPKGRHHDNIMMSQGTSEGYALKRLHRERPDLHARVVAGELKANTAMVQAGLRPRTLTVKPGDPSSVARSLQRNMTAEDIATLVQLLKEPDQGGILGG